MTLGHLRSHFISWFILSSLLEWKLLEIRDIAFSLLFPRPVTICSAEEISDGYLLNERTEKRMVERVNHVKPRDLVSHQLLEYEIFLFNSLRFSLHVLKCVPFSLLHW